MEGLAVARRSLSRVLVAEDERDLADLLRFNLTREGYEVTVAANGAEALKKVHDLKPELVLLDIMVPQLNGWEICRRIKQSPETRGTAVIMVTGRVEEGDKVLGFEVGADDYVTKPFSIRELLARVRAVLRRTHAGDTETATTIKVGGLEVDRYRFEVRMNGRKVKATRREFELLAILAGAPGRVFAREELLDAVWGRDGFVEPRTVDVHLARMRSRFQAASVPEPAIETVRGIGYRMREAGS
jgi:DNA-binding response OmpR family regulator